MGFFKNPFKSVKNLVTDPVKFAQNSLPTIGAIIGTTIAPGIGTAIGAGLGETGKNLAEGQSIGDSLKGGAISGAGAYVGSSIGNSLFGPGGAIGNLGTVGNPGNAFSGSVNLGNLGSTAANTFGNDILGSSIGTTLGTAVGMGAGNAYKETPQMEQQGLATNVTPFMPKQQDQQETPASLQGFGSLTDQQKSSNLASQGVYGGGNGAQEQSYFINLLNRRLVDSGGNVSDLSGVSPIEQSYLQKLGISGYGNSRNLLEAISKWKPA